MTWGGGVTVAQGPVRPGGASGVSSSAAPSIVVVSTYPPTRCGLASYAASLMDGLTGNRESSDGLHVVRVLCEGDGYDSDARVVAAFDPGSPSAVTAAAARISTHDVALLQHEFGIYGPDDGVAVTHLAASIDAPIVTTLHTVAEEPTPARMRIVKSIAAASTRVTVTIPSAAELLVDRYGVSAHKIAEIPHGSAWDEPTAPDVPVDRTILLTWGLLSPPKGVQHAIAALSELRDHEPRPLYWIQGATHPVIRRKEGESYRLALQSLAEDLGVADMVHFDERYLSTSALAGLVAAADVIVLPYEQADHISSGVLAEAIAMGKRIVATAFSHAHDLKDGDKGIVLVDHGDPGQIAKAVRMILEDPEHELAAKARKAAAPSWESVASIYDRLASEIVGTSAYPGGVSHAGGRRSEIPGLDTQVP